MHLSPPLPRAAARLLWLLGLTGLLACPQVVSPPCPEGSTRPECGPETQQDGGSGDAGSDAGDGSPSTQPTWIQPPSGTLTLAATDGGRARKTLAFTATAGHTYRFTCIRDVNNGCTLRLLDGSGAVLDQDEVGTDAGLVQARVKARSPRGEAFFIELSALSNAGGTYGWRLEDLGLDDHGDTPASATERTGSAMPVTGNIDFPSDEDTFAIARPRSTIGRWSCTLQGTPDYWNIHVRDASGVTLQSGNGHGPGALTGAIHVAPSSEPLFFSIVSHSPSFTGAYTCTLEDLGLDDHGNTRATATPIEPSANSITGTMAYYGDIDMLSTSLRAGHFYRSQCLQPHVETCGVEFLDASGARVFQHYESNAAEFKVPATGTYFIQLTAIDGPYPYSYTLEDLGLDDHGDVPGSGTTVFPSQEVRGILTGLADTDVFSFSATGPGHIFSFDCATVDGTRSWNAFRGELLFPGTYHVELSAGAETTTWPLSYRCRLVDEGPAP
jgi:hypothetical protein